VGQDWRQAGLGVTGASGVRLSGGTRGRDIGFKVGNVIDNE